MGHLEIAGVGKSFGGLRALDRVNISLEQGRITGLIGPNGAGKTTLYNVVTGFLVPDEGEVRYKGAAITGEPPLKRVRRGICRTFQNLRLFPRLSVLENVLVGIPNQQSEGLWVSIFGGRGQERRHALEAMEILASVGLADRAATPAADLGMGEQKVLCIARLLATNADVMLLDEPTANLDHREIDRVFELIKGLAESGKTICITEHNIELIVDLCDWVYALHLGQNIAEGTPHEVVHNPMVLGVYLGEEWRPVVSSRPLDSGAS